MIIVKILAQFKLYLKFRTLSSSLLCLVACGFLWATAFCSLWKHFFTIQKYESKHSFKATKYQRAFHAQSLVSEFSQTTLRSRHVTFRHSFSVFNNFRAETREIVDKRATSLTSAESANFHRHLEELYWINFFENLNMISQNLHKALGFWMNHWAILYWHQRAVLTRTKM